MNLDKELIKQCNADNIKKLFNSYKLSKTDSLSKTPTVTVPMGIDGVKWEHFEKDLNNRSNSICKKLKNGKYKFKPFREEIKSKNPKLSNEESFTQNNYRILSVSCIDDVIVQKLLFNILSSYAEKFIFVQTDNLSFAYRPQKSAPQAAKKLYFYMKHDYIYALDADIKSFFDEIPHFQLVELLERLLGSDNEIFIRYLKSFIKVPRVKYETYKGNVKMFHFKKPITTKRISGIPQGGILSGILANLYLHPFDLWIKDTLSKSFDIKYVRYADDFIILGKNIKDIPLIKEEVRYFLNEIKLTLHPDLKKTKIINLENKCEEVDFVGFSISPTGIRIKKNNLNRFKERVRELIYKDKIFDTNLNLGIYRLNYKIIGNEMANRYCKTCGFDEVRRSWLDYFLSITDIQQLKSLDLFIRREIYGYINYRYGECIKKKDLIKLGLLSLEIMYYKFHKQHIKYCRCSLEDQVFTRRGTPGYIKYLIEFES